jgi:hypothetical protein
MLSNRELYVSNLISGFGSTDLEDLVLEINDCFSSKKFNVNRHRNLNLFIDAVRRLNFSDEVFLAPFANRALVKREMDILKILSEHRNLQCLGVTKKLYKEEDFNNLYLRKQRYERCYVALHRLLSFGYVRSSRTAETSRRNNITWNITAHGKHKLTLPMEEGRRYIRR